VCEFNSGSPKTPRPFDFDKHPKRYIAIKYAYLGWHYNGLAYSDPATTPLPTVELELFKALEKVRLIQNSESCNYSRCGRTDRGVSAMGQVSAMVVRSNVQSQDRIENGGRGYTLDDKGKSRGSEFDYVQILNGVLPETIRVIAWCPIPDDFSARFSCRGRHYRYFLTNVNGELDTDAMRKAAGYFVGEHDFRNFCKLDIQKQITNFSRRIMRADFVPYENLPASNNSTMWTFELQGTAFLWHQVRCMMAILFLVGQRLEEPEIVRDMLDVEKYPTKPEYAMASDLPLVLYDCLFDNLNWIYPDISSRVHRNNLGGCFALWHETKLRETLSGLLCKAVGQSQEILHSKDDEGKVSVLDGSGDRKATRVYRKVAKRTRQEAFDVLNERYRKTARYEHQQQKREAKGKAQGVPDDDS
jgi:tRNA pseudouridine38/39 synthase